MCTVIKIMPARDIFPKLRGRGVGRRFQLRKSGSSGQNGIEMAAGDRFGGSLRLTDFPEESAAELSIVTDTCFAVDSLTLPEVPLTPSVSPIG